ncbi:MAG: hypothetical protein KBF88_17635, partial [Polyangiaceae bacterium]|nr:hypothetical protein [Polyangiaceae bacterium]
MFASTLFTLTGMWTQGCGDGANAVDIETSAKDGGRCDPKLSPLEDPCVVTDAFGVFVSPNAAASGDGTQKAPFNDLRVAFARAISTSKPNVFLCGTHKAEGVEVPDGLHVFGAFECNAAKWVLSQSVRAKIESLGSGKPILLVKGSTKGVRIEAVDFVARA